MSKTTIHKDASCFHCHLPVTEAEAHIPSLLVFGKQRHFCCLGCHAVCETIIDNGLESYYKTRTLDEEGANLASDDILQQLRLYDREEIQREFVVSGKQKAGEWREASLLLENIRCPACLWLNERHLRAQTGVLEVFIDDLTQRATVKWNPKQTQLSKILEAITQIGYIARPYDPRRSEKLLEARKRRSLDKIIFAGVLGMMVMQFSVVTYILGTGATNMMGTWTGEGMPLWIVIGRWTSLLITLAIMIFSGQDFFVGAWRDIKSGRFGMDVPIVLGLSIALVGSVVTTITHHGETYYDSIVMFIFFLLVARRWEMQGRLKAADRLDRLATIQPAMARRVDKVTGQEQMISVNDLEEGDLIRILPGETAVVEAQIEEGQSSFDNSVLSGEVMPTMRNKGDDIHAGSVNIDQAVIARVTKTVQFSTITQMQKMVSQGLEQSPQTLLMTQWVAKYFTVFIVVIAVVTALGWLWLDPESWLPNTIAVLIITCPCALSLAAPTALSVAAGKFIEKGLLPLNMAKLENLAKSDLLVFDKTGTLTAGVPELIEVKVLGDVSKEDVLQIASALSRQSVHPLSKALVKAYSKEEVRADNIVNYPGAGLVGQVGAEIWKLGNLEFFGSVPDLPEDVEEIISLQQSQGHIITVLGTESKIVALLVFADCLKADVEQTLTLLKAHGLGRMVILSGDAQQNVTVTGQKVGIDEVYGDLKPEEKMAWVRDKQQSGHKVMMVGDGLNDAPVLALADVSISFSSATDLAGNSSDFLVSIGELMPLAKGRILAEKTLSNIRQNLGWALAYNVIAIPLAALGYIPPWGAAIGMSLSSLIVVLNALRLQRV